MSDMCHQLHRLCGLRPRFGFPFDASSIPRNGIYLLFEKGEEGHGGDRIVRVGTHNGQGQLRSRLRQHFLVENKDRSIFRKNIGRALLAKANDPFAESWELDLTSREGRKQHGHLVDTGRQREIEADVSTYIRERFTFVVFEVPAKEDRLRIESRLISTVSHCNDCGPSSTWLGLSSPKEKIRESGLWLVNELYKTECSNDEIDALRTMLVRSVL